MKYSVVVPCYNEEGNIYKVVDEFVNVNNVLSKDGFELILVDNGSSDGTLSEIEQCVIQYSFVKKVVVEVNKGYGYGILQGMAETKGDYVGWIHADLQFSPLLFIDIAKKIDKENDKFLYLKGLRKKRPLLDTFFTIGMSCFESIYLNTGLWDINAQPTMMNRDLFEGAVNPPHGFALDLYFYYMAKQRRYKIIRFSSVQKAREIGESSWNSGMKARIKLVKRTLHDSKAIKKVLHK